MDLGEHLAADGGLARRIGKDRRVEERNQRWTDLLGRSIGEHRRDRAEHLSTPQRTLSPIDGRDSPFCLRELPEAVDQAARQPDTDRHALLLVNRRDQPTDDPGDMERQAVGCFRRPKGATALTQGWSEPRELTPKGLGEERFVEAARERIHVSRPRRLRSRSSRDPLHPQSHRKRSNRPASPLECIARKPSSAFIPSTRR